MRRSNPLSLQEIASQKALAMTGRSPTLFEQLPEGQYYVYSIITDTETAADSAYSSGPLLIIHRQKGDLMGDQAINQANVGRLVEIIFGLNSPNAVETYLADINTDNIIDIRDVIALVDMMDSRKMKTKINDHDDK